MSYYLQHTEVSDDTPEGMELSMFGMGSNRLGLLLKPALKEKANKSIIMDMGCGTGILGMYALDHGADFVYFVEQNDHMVHILENVLPKKLNPDKYKIIHKDIENLATEDFEFGAPDVVISELYGPRLFDEGYVAYARHIRSMFPNCYFIPEKFEVEFFIGEVDYSQPIWPDEESVLDHFKFMYAGKGFSRWIESKRESTLGYIRFNANTLEFDNLIEFTYDINDERLLMADAVIRHDNYEQSYTTFGWFMSTDDYRKKIQIYFDEKGYFNPRKNYVNT